MPLLWSSPNNRFANKHLHVVQGAQTLEALLTEGRRVFAARVQAFQLKQNRRTRNTPLAKQLKDTYGTTKKSPTSNTLIVLSDAGLQALAAAIGQNGYAPGWYTVANGVVFDAGTGNSHSESLVAELELGVRPVPGSSNHEVYHLEKLRTKVRLKTNVPTAAYAQTRVQNVPGSGGTLGLAFAPTAGELGTAKAGLRPTATNVRQSLPTVALGCPVDLSFLDED